MRVLVDARLQVSGHAAIFGPGETWVAHAVPPDWPDNGHRQRLLDRGVRLLYLPAADGRYVDLPALMRVMGEAGFNEVHVEAGAGLNADGGGAPLLLEHDIAALGAEGDLDRVCALVAAFEKF